MMMLRFDRVCFFLIVFFGVAGVALAQDFPYSVPMAPEFDDRGNYTGPGTPTPGANGAQQDQVSKPGGQPKQYHSSAGQLPPQQPLPQRPVQQRPSMPPQPGRQANAASRPQQPAVQERPDCTPFPMMIAQARSDPEMQATAKLYLTCLLKSGWQMEAAKSQVISTIESTYRLAR